ncbi:ras-related protein Rab-20-like isoform X2 [Xenia sp. Carnegie-2017]|nr:ras-related protein Rab-20-like isoform X2 [Xenia sp. Carnegie-2017]
MDGVFTSKATTIGASFLLKNWGPYNVAIWDTAGEEKYARLSSFYCRGASAAILAYDITRYDSYNILKQRHIPLLEAAEEKCLCVVVGTKLDIVKNSSRQISSEMGKNLAKAQNEERLNEMKTLPFFETSSKTGKNVEDVFEFILNTCLPLDEKVKKKLPLNKDNIVDLNEPSHGRQKCC